MTHLLNGFRCEILRSKLLVDKVIAQELPKILIVPNRTKYWHNRHRDDRYRRERGRKLWPVELPDFDKWRNESDNMSPDQVRSKLKEKGLAPPTNYSEREIYTPSTITVIEPYEPPKGDGKSSSLLDKVKRPLSAGRSFVKDKREVSSIKSFEGEDFDLKEFAKQSTEIYIKAHEALAAKDEKQIFDYVTEYCFPLMASGLSKHTIHWNYLGDVEPPEVVQVRSGDLLSKGNKYSQITVKMHTKQTLAVYDRHGRLVHGSPIDVKEVLEYIVFEKYLANEYGNWRVHSRIRPNEDGSSFSQQVSKTYVQSTN